MGKTWVLDTETKGTGAHVAPLEGAKPSRERELALVNLGAPPPAPAQPPVREPRLFKVVNVMTAEVLAEDVEAREAVRALEALDRVIDARVFVRVPASPRWRLLSLEQARALWGFRGRLDAPELAMDERASRSR